MKFNISTTVLPMQADQLFAERDTAAFQALLMKSLKLGRMEFVSIDKDMSQGAYIVKLVTQPELGSWVPKCVFLRCSIGNTCVYHATPTQHHTQHCASTSRDPMALSTQTHSPTTPPNCVPPPMYCTAQQHHHSSPTRCGGVLRTCWACP